MLCPCSDFRRKAFVSEGSSFRLIDRDLRPQDPPALTATTFWDLAQASLVTRQEASVASRCRIPFRLLVLGLVLAVAFAQLPVLPVTPVHAACDVTTNSLVDSVATTPASSPNNSGGLIS